MKSLAAPRRRTVPGGMAALVLLLLAPVPALLPAPAIAASFVPWGALAAQVEGEGESLRRTVDGLAQAWARGNPDGVANHFARGGVSLKLDGPVRTSVAPRQASAALRDFFRNYEGGEIQVVRAAPLAGTPDRGFAEIRWSAPMSGTSQSVQRSLFLGLFFDGEAWRVDELRLLP